MKIVMRRLVFALVLLPTLAGGVGVYAAVTALPAHGVGIMDLVVSAPPAHRGPGDR